MQPLMVSTTAILAFVRLNFNAQIEPALQPFYIYQSPIFYISGVSIQSNSLALRMFVADVLAVLDIINRKGDDCILLSGRN